jgi:hypothetical protein
LLASFGGNADCGLRRQRHIDEGLEGMRQPFSDPLQTALIQVEPIIDFFT